MLKILVTLKESLCILRRGLGWKTLNNQCSGMSSHKLHKCCTVSGRLPSATSLTVVEEGGELKKLDA